MGISAVVITYNETNNIADCLESINWTDEIIVIDSGSSDNTAEIAKKYTDKVIIQEWKGYSNQKNYGINLAKNDWILSIDADERVPSDLKNEILKVIESKDFNGYFLPRHSYFLGKWINHCGWYPDYQLRLFKKTKGKFNERVVHEGVGVSGKIGYLTHDLIHFPYGNLTHYFEKLNEYTDLSSKELREKRNKKFNVFQLLFHPPFVFLKSYFWKLGFLDGLAGLGVSILNAMNTFVKYAKLWELNREKNRKNFNKNS